MKQSGFHIVLLGIVATFLIGLGSVAAVYDPKSPIGALISVPLWSAGLLAGLIALLNVIVNSWKAARIAVGALALISIASIGWSYSVLEGTAGSWLVPDSVEMR